MKLFRAMSEEEYLDFKKNGFACTDRTISGKQLFKSRIAVEDFVFKSQQRNYNPPYKQILEIETDLDGLKAGSYDEQILDTHKAITIYEEHLSDFNKSYKFINCYGI